MDADVLLRLLLLSEMIYAAEHPLPTIDDVEDEEDEN